jgi:hypothetical protein
MAYHKFKDDEGSFETFYFDASGPDVLWRDPSDPDSGRCETGWYWWACFPGCLPDGEPSGPFATEQDAIRDAQENG